MAERGRLALETGRCFEGILFGAGVPEVSGEVVFNTCMTGYQEVVTDPSYAGQVVVMTYPLIGNYGCRDEDAESSRVWARAMVVRELSPQIGHPLGERSLDDELRRHGVPGLRGVDTRALTRHLRDHGAVRGVLGPAAAASPAEQVARARSAPHVGDQDLVGEVTLGSPWMVWEEPLHPTLERALRVGGGLGAHAGVRIVAVDYGVKRNSLRALRSRGAEVVLVRAGATLDDVLRHRPDGVMLSNGPGDPAVLPEAVRLCAALLERRIPLLGICLGHQVLGRALGATTSRLAFGHHGGNHPVHDI
ncbi:MAG: carbamoyl-phosphate synthase small subunit, partial [Chloroflexota bacterium]|nr:carbamoyl-phosphate synthase small subunit [Chloroflexota bacterium]